MDYLPLYLALSLIILIVLILYLGNYNMTRKEITIFIDKGVITMNLREYKKYITKLIKSLNNISYAPEHINIGTLMRRSIKELEKNLPPTDVIYENPEIRKLVMEYDSDTPLKPLQGVRIIQWYLTAIKSFPSSCCMDLRDVVALSKIFYAYKRTRKLIPIAKRHDKIRAIENIIREEAKSNSVDVPFKSELDEPISKPLEGLSVNKEAFREVDAPVVFNQAPFTEADIPFVFERMQNPKKIMKHDGLLKRTILSDTSQYDTQGKTKL